MLAECLPTWENLSNGMRNSRGVTDVGDDAATRSQPLGKLLPNIHLHNTQYQHGKPSYYMPPYITCAMSVPIYA